MKPWETERKVYSFNCYNCNFINDKPQDDKVFKS